MNKERACQIANDIKNHYITFYISKRHKGKRRQINAPMEDLKSIQNEILEEFIYKIKPNPIACGFVKNKTLQDAAKVHVNKKLLISVDITDFFNSFHTSQIVRMFIKRFNVTYDEAELYGRLLTFNGIVPQGAPSSPALTNALCQFLGVDKQLQDLAKLYGAEVTRYADDITFSFNTTVIDITNFLLQIKFILRKYHLEVNGQKTHVSRYYNRMTILGMVVNEKLNINKQERRNFRAYLHKLKVNKVSINKNLRAKIRGKIEWYGVNKDLKTKYLKEFGQLNFC